MKRLIAKYKENGTEQLVNIPANNIKESENMIFAYQDDSLVGIFSLGLINALYLSES